ncbi:uncharacterized protein EI97DRAFT_412704 [Westerdykella ornata]|uniref:Integral membrane protein n=1 Tax=Westerdykella ornata TaxID=318751 RepID=A0A6A6JT90_WESOR|nr:uncharacterized protein EI97DRAFT_412704 [Westerdykella ornata]KAF2279577.1 hypothetical protein EI97DRAFT_412704 [Westerdykella ornata]
MAFRSLSPSRLVVACLVLITVYTAFRLHAAATRDPTSVFFDTRKGYEPRYSKIRAQEAEDFIASAAAAAASASASTAGSNNSSSSQPQPNPPRPPSEDQDEKTLCVAIPTISRKHASYLPLTLGSLLHGLTPQERAQIHLIVFIAHSDPTSHPLYTSPWLWALSDEVLTYPSTLSPADLHHVQEMESQGGLFREKGLYDYSFLLRRCAALESVEYVAVFEDDVVAVQGWYARARAALETAHRLSVERYAKEFLYLRLFFTEEFLGWNVEDWRSYAGYSALAVGLPVLLLWGLRRWMKRVAGVMMSQRFVFCSVPLFVVCLILVLFALGRLTVMPLPDGVYEMPAYGCCSQALVFPRSKVAPLIEWFEERKVGFVDVLTEEFADKGDEVRWVVRPSLVQHVGRWSSKEDGSEGGKEGKKGKAALSAQEKIWSFGFEEWGEKIRQEGDTVKHEGGG